MSESPAYEWPVLSPTEKAILVVMLGWYSGQYKRQELRSEDRESGSLVPEGCLAVPLLVLDYSLQFNDNRYRNLPYHVKRLVERGYIQYIQKVDLQAWDGYRRRKEYLKESGIIHEPGDYTRYLPFNEGNYTLPDGRLIAVIDGTEDDEDQFSWIVLLGAADGQLLDKGLASGQFILTDQGKIIAETLAFGDRAFNAFACDEQPATGKNAADDKPPSKRVDKLEWLAKAILTLQEHPDWSSAEIAKKVGKHRSTLSRNSIYKTAAALARGQRTDLPSGYLTVDPDTGQTDVEAYE